MDFMNYNFNVSRIIFACHVKKDGGTKVHRNRASHGLALHMDGKKEYFFDNKKGLKVEKNKMIYLPKGSNYDVYREIHGECYAINFELDEQVDFEPFVMHIKNSDQIIELFKSTQRIWKAKEIGYEMECKANLYRILCFMQKEGASSYLPSEKERLITPAVEYIRLHYTDNTIGISFLAELCGITPEYFRQIFKALHGDSPLSYINRKRIANAKELLESGICSITEAAEASGYTDMSHFSRTFKATYGISARDYIKSR